ncbi:unnamed protein product [Protopolystoma xenopodis]|uniref:Uncharacterized protein n=1 Tax=Protopolystoma xenopodis TaxID=117903 RepID=A0A3S5AWG5_9PLAT|nr:unnamed protein product [Protopolystoma xenopodis]
MGIMTTTMTDDFGLGAFYMVVKETSSYLVFQQNVCRGIGFTCLFDEFVAWCRRMASLTDDADYDAGETSENVSSPQDGKTHMPTTMPAKRLRMYQVHCQMLGIMITTIADDFGLGAFYMVFLKTRPSCDNEVNPRIPYVISGCFSRVCIRA